MISFIYSTEENVTEKVDVITLKSFCKRNKIEKIELLKIDTEGYEFNVLKGLNEYIKMLMSYSLNIIMITLIKNYKFSDIHNFLVKNKFKKVFKNKMIFRKIFEYIYINERLKTK